MGFWSWLADTAQRHGDDLSVAYTLDGDPLPDESEVKGLAGHRGWGPVRVGNAAGTQRQHDVYGHVLAAASHCYHHMDMESAAPQAVLNRLADLAARRWHRPDNSIWEVRGRRAHHTYSHLMCWLALDRAVDLAAHGALAGDSARWAAQRDAARQAILERAWDPILGPSPARSAAATSTPPPSSPRSSGSSRPTTPVPLHTPGRDRPPRRQRAPAPVLPRRRTRGRDAAFLLCTLWLADTHTVEGDPDRGEELLERVLATGNDLGLLAEEADPATGAPLGNFPQGLTHLAVIESVHRLAGAP